MPPPAIGPDDPLPAAAAWIGGAQHVAAMVVGIVTPPLLLAASMALPEDETRALVSASLLASGLATALQVGRLGPIGSGLLTVQGTSFVYVPLALEAARQGGLPLVFGSAIAAAPVELAVAALIVPARRLLPPVVTGSLVTLIGLSLTGVALSDLAGGPGAPDAGSPLNLALGLAVTGTILAWSARAPGIWRTGSVVAGLLLGCGLAAALGRLNLSGVASVPWAGAPRPLAWGLTVDPVLLVPWGIATGIATIEAIGILAATAEASGVAAEGPAFLRRLRAGLVADSVGSVLAGLLGALPNTTFSQNNGVIALTGVASRRVGLAAAGLLVLLGLSPRLAAVLTAIPRPVLGGATLLLFGAVAVSGLRLAWSAGMGPRDQTILGATLAVGLGLTMHPDAIGPWGADLAGGPGAMARAARTLASSGLTMGALTAILLHASLPADATGPRAPARPVRGTNDT